MSGIDKCKTSVIITVLFRLVYMQRNQIISYIPGYSHNWSVPYGEEHLFWPGMHQYIQDQKPSHMQLHYVRWGLYEDAPKNWRESFPKYFRELRRSSDITATSILQEHIHRTQPNILVAHSMGANLLFNAVEYGLDLGCVQKIILLQPDISIYKNIKAFSESIKKNNRQLVHTWCPWDDLLGPISIYTGSLRLGQIPHPYNGIQSVFFPLSKKSSKHSHTGILQHHLEEIYNYLGIKI